MNKNKMRYYLLIVIFAFSLLFVSCDSSIKKIESYSNPQEQLNFFVIGDWGRDGEFKQQEVAEAMGKLGDSLDVSFIVSTGDNFYMSGVESTEDSAWFTSYENVYTAPSLQKPWYVVLGNHDYSGNIQAQLDYTKRSTRWYMPSQFYHKVISLNKRDSVLFVFMDTSPFEHKHYISKYYQHNIHNQDTLRQKLWLDSLLANNKSKWKIVVGHHPLYTGGSRKDEPNTVRNSIEEILEKYRVDAYFAGHEHDLQHLKPEGKTVEYFVSGAGSKLRETFGIPATKFGVSQSGFLSVSLNTDSMQLNFIDYLGNDMYKCTILKSTN